MDFDVIATGYDRMTGTSSRTQLTNILVEILRSTPIESIAKVAYLTQGKLYPDFLSIEIGMAEKTVAKAMERAFGVDSGEITTLLRKTGDLGDVAAILSQKKGQQAFFSEKLTVEKVYSTFAEIARTSGTGSASARINKLALLLNSASSLEAKFLTRFVTGKLRLGVADFTVLDALSILFTGGKEARDELEKAYNLTSDLGEVAHRLASGGLSAIKSIKVTVGKPVRPMLAERMESLESIAEKMNHDAVCEYKLDGERIQAHKKSKGDVSLFSRRLENITEQYLDVVRALKDCIFENFIVEGEVVAVGANGTYLPFQELMHRRRKYEIEDAMKKYPVNLNLFDILFFEGQETIDESYDNRRKLLELNFQDSKKIDPGTVKLVPARRLHNVKPMEELMKESLARGCEGLMIKDPKSTYRAGARGYAWIKFKPEYRKEVRDTLDLVIVGANHGRGRRAGVYGAFLLAAYDEATDTFKTTTKIGTGFSDLDLENLGKQLEKHILDKKSPRVEAKVKAEVWFEPFIVIEVVASEITLSPIYSAGLEKIRRRSGLALRFPKFTGRIRADKAAEDATSETELLELYQKQIRQYRPS